MKGSGIKFLREKLNLTKRDLANKLEISERTLANWETEGKDHVNISAPHTLYLQMKIFGPGLLTSLIRQIEEDAFKISPSEYISMWLVFSEEIVLFRNTARHAFLFEEQKHDNSLVCKSFDDKNSLTILPLRTGLTLCRGGKNGIESLKPKGQRNRMSSYLQDGICFSVMKIPFLCEGRSGPIPKFLLNLENKLVKQKDKWLVNKTDKPGIYTEEDEKELRGLLKKYYDREFGKILNKMDGIDETH
jgi:Helix-turn-helix.